MKIFGREPIAIIAGLQALLALFCSLGWLATLGINTQGDVAIVVLVLNAAAAVVVAITTRATLLAPVVELAKAVLSLAAIYNLHLSNEQTGFLLGAIPLLLALLHRSQTTPVATAISNA